MRSIYHLLDESEAFSEGNGGAISRWAANVLREGREIVVCPSFDASWRFPSERIYQLPGWSFAGRVHPILYRIPWALQQASYLRFLDPLLTRLSPGDVVYVHNRPETAAVLATLARERGVHVVLHMHNSLLLDANRGQIEALRSTPIVFCSEFLRKEAHAAYPNHFERTSIVYNGADGSKFRVAKRGRPSVPTIIYTGRIVAYKGIHVLLEAMRMLGQNGVKAQCKIVGASWFGNSRPTRYQRKLQAAKPDNTEFLGYMVGGALAEALQGADIFCCPSIWNDPFPLAPLEAMATGLPVVASDTGGIPEMLAHGGGILVPPNQPSLLTAALTRLIGDASYREELRDQAVASFNGHFRWTSVREQYERVLAELPA